MLDVEIGREESAEQACSGFDSPRLFTLEQAMEHISEEELVEVTPTSLRLRKKNLKGWGRMMGGK